MLLLNGFGCISLSSISQAKNKKVALNDMERQEHVHCNNESLDAKFRMRKKEELEHPPSLS